LIKISNILLKLSDKIENLSATTDVWTIESIVKQQYRLLQPLSKKLNRNIIIDKRNIGYFKVLNFSFKITKCLILYTFKNIYKFKNAKQVNIIENVGGDLRQMTLSADKNSAVVIDRTENTLLTIQTNGEIIKNKKLTIMNDAKSICITSENHTIFINRSRDLVVLDPNNNVIKRIPSSIFQFNDYLIMDDQNPSIFIVSAMNAHRVYLIDVNQDIIDCHTVPIIEVKNPYELFSKNDKIYVISLTTFDTEKCSLDNKLDKLVGITGQNCVFVFDKKTQKIVQKIKCANWLRPQSLHVDENDNIITCAFKFDKDKIISKYLYLFVFNKDGELIKDIYLEGLCLFRSGIFIQNKLLVHGTDCILSWNDPQWIKIYEFE
jgi:hypothetical protein